MFSINFINNLSSQVLDTIKIELQNIYVDLGNLIKKGKAKVIKDTRLVKDTDQRITFQGLIIPKSVPFTADMFNNEEPTGRIVTQIRIAQTVNPKSVTIDLGQDELWKKIKALMTRLNIANESIGQPHLYLEEILYRLKKQDYCSKQDKYEDVSIYRYNFYFTLPFQDYSLLHREANNMTARMISFLSEIRCPNTPCKELAPIMADYLTLSDSIKLMALSRSIYSATNRPTEAQENVATPSP